MADAGGLAQLGVLVKLLPTNFWQDVAVVVFSDTVRF